MKEPPRMLSNKDLLHISDILLVSLTFIKKITAYIEIVEDQDIKTKLEEVKTKLTNDYSKLMEVLS